MKTDNEKSKLAEISLVNGEGQTRFNALSNSWFIQVNRAIDCPRQMSQQHTKVCIYKVPQSIMVRNRQAYLPLAVSLGPYHHKMNLPMSAIDQRKVEAVHRMLKRLNITKEELIGYVKNLESKIMECYDEAIDSDGETLSLVLAMDACFVLDFFSPLIIMEDCRCSFCQSSKDENGVYSFQLDKLIDIMKLENQIPWFVLQGLLQVDCNDATSHVSGLLYSVMYPFSCPSSADGKSFAVRKLIQYIKKDPFHLLDLKRMVIANLLTDLRRDWATAFEPDGYSSTSNIRCYRRWPEWSISFELPGCCISILDRLWPTHYQNSPTPRAQLLHRAGIKFKPRQIGFERNKLFLPRIVVDDNTETMLMNLMAYEECRRRSGCPEGTIISHFVCFLNDLIDSEKDVAVLKEDGIIDSYLGSDKEVADIFNRLGKGISVDIGSYGFKFQLAAEQAKKHYYSPWKKPIRRVKEAYCSKPCFFVTILAAFAMLVMVAVQMVYSIKDN